MNCWQCGKVDDVETLSKVFSLPRKEVFKLLKSVKPLREEDLEEPDRNLILPKCIGDFLPAHLSYLKKRGFDPDYLSQVWDVRGIGQSPEATKWSLFIPIYERSGRLVSWTTRSVSNSKKRRYLSAPKENELISHKSLLYGCHLARNVVIIVEGPLDAWAIGPGAVATLGLSYTLGQVKLMISYPFRVICFDSTPDAQKRAERLCEELSCFSGSTEMILLETGEDPASASKEEIEELRETYLEV